MKKEILLLGLIAVIVVALALISGRLLGVRISSRRFPDDALRGAIKSYVDKDRNGYLSKQELEEARIVVVLGPCHDLTGVEYLTNTETLSFDECYDLTGIESMTNLKDLHFGDQCPDLSPAENVTNLEEISFNGCAFDERFVFDNDIPVGEVRFRDCVFEDGILFKNDHVDYIELGYCGYGECEASGDLVFADCEKLYWFRGEFDSTQKRSFSIDLSGCGNLDWALITAENEQTFTSADLGNCGKLRSFAMYDSNYDDGETEVSLNICGSLNIEEATLAKGVKELDISDCPHLLSATEHPPYEERFKGFKYESEDGYLHTYNENLVFIK